MTEDDKRNTLNANLSESDEDATNKESLTASDNKEPDKKLIFDALSKEYVHAKQDINMYLGILFKVTTVWLTVLGAIAYYGILSKLDSLPIYILLVGNFFLVILEFVMAWLLSFIMNLGGYKASIEIQLNKVIGVPILSWDHKLVKDLHHKCVAQYCVYGLCISLTGLLMVLNYDIIWNQGWMAKTVLKERGMISGEIVESLKNFWWSILSLQIVVIILGLFTILSAHDKAFESSNRAFEGN